MFGYILCLNYYNFKKVIFNKCIIFLICNEINDIYGGSIFFNVFVIKFFVMIILGY